MQVQRKVLRKMYTKVLIIFVRAELLQSEFVMWTQ